MWKVEQLLGSLVSFDFSTQKPAFPGGLTLHMVLLSAWDQTEQIAIENIAKTSCTAVNKIMM